MRYLIAYIYILLSGVAVPFFLQGHSIIVASQAHDPIARKYLLPAGEITMLSLLRDFFLLSSLTYTLFCVMRALMLLLPFLRKRLRMSRILNASILAFTGFLTASLALTNNMQVFGNGWAFGEGFMTFVAPVWHVIFIIVAVGAYIGAQLDKGSTDSRRQAAA